MAGWDSVSSYPHSHAACPSSLFPHFCIRALHRPVRRRFTLDHASLEPRGILEAGGELLCCCHEMAGPEGQSSSMGAAIKGFNRVEEAVS